MHLAPGGKLGPYEILALIGAGGMGEVFRARDTRLNRDVAIKTAHAQFNERFSREALAIAALNHTNICHLYDVGPDYLVMEFVEGPDLASAIRGPLAFQEALPIIRQLIDGIEAAHEKNIIHRDLKPANIKITPEGVVKILDFGLAKAMEPPPAQDGNPENSPTLTIGATQAGTILGTASYMAPEQAKGKAADKRSDIWSFGVIVHELLTGRRLFPGETAVEILGAVLNRDPDISAAPPRVHKLLRWCLEKDRQRRLASISDARRLLEEEPLAVVSPPTPAPSRKLPWILAAGLFAATTAVALWSPWRTEKPPPDRPLVRLDVDLGADVSLSAPVAGGSAIAISSDGTRLAYPSGNPAKLFVRRLDQASATELPGTDGAASPFFSPDGQWIGFSSQGKLKKILVEGGAVTVLAEVPNFAGASWGEDGSIIVSNALNGGLLRIPADGAAPETLAEVGKGEIALGRPQILPGGKSVLYTNLTSLNGDTATIEVMTLADRHRKIVSHGGTHARYLPTSDRAGHLVYLNKATLFAIPFDLDKLETRGAAVPVLDDIAFEIQTRTAQYDFSRNGSLVYRKGTGTSSFLMSPQWADPSGKRETLRAKPGIYSGPSISPDGKRVALDLVTDTGSRDVWIYDQQRDSLARSTFSGGPYSTPVWSPNGQYLVFGSLRAGLVWTRADRAGQPQPLLQGPSTLVASSFSYDGKWLAFSQGIGLHQIWTAPVEDQGGQLKPGKAQQFLSSAFDDTNAVFSPDGRWLAYQSTESGKYEVYVRAFPPPASGQGGEWQISNNGGASPHWTRNGHELAYQSGDQILTASYKVKNDSFVAEKPRVWIEKLGGTDWDLSPDGKKVLVLVPLGNADTTKQEHEIVLLENFFDELRRKVPLK